MANNLGIKTSMHVQGLDGLRITLAELPERIASKVLSDAVATGARVSLKRARELVPEDTGLLKRMLRATRGKRTELAAAAYVSIRRLSAKAILKYKMKGGKAAATNSADPYYWSILEFGKTPRTKHPFIRPAFEQTKEQAAKVIADKIGKGVEVHTEKLRRENMNK